MIGAARRIPRRASAGGGVLLLVSVVVFGLWIAEPVWGVDEDPDGNLSVVVTDGDESPASPSPTARPSASPTPVSPVSSPPPRRSNGSPSSGNVEQVTVTSSGTADALGSDPIVVDGILSVSRLLASVEPSFTPGNGVVSLSFTVRNSSSTPFDATARFWIENAVGARVASTDDIAVNGLEPGETRRVIARIDGLGQYTYLTGHVTFTPPDEVEGTPLEPLSRDTIIVLPPLFSLAVGGGLAAIGGLTWWLVGPRGIRLLFTPGLAKAGV